MLVDLVDTAGGYTTLRAETPHLITVVGAVLLALLARGPVGGTDDPAQRPLRRQTLLRTLRQRRLLPDLARFVPPPTRSGAWNTAHSDARVRLRTAPTDDDTAEDDHAAHRIA
jgi:hypothetical protein